MHFKNIDVDIDKLPPTSPLIAKIAIAFLFFTFGGNIAYVNEFLELRNHCRFGSTISENRIFRTRSQEESSYAKHHSIYLESHDKFHVLNISLFGYCCWTAILTSEIPIMIGECNGKVANASCLRLDFSDPKNKKKFLGLRYIGEKNMLMQRYDI